MVFKIVVVLNDEEDINDDSYVERYNLLNGWIENDDVEFSEGKFWSKYGIYGILNGDVFD